MSPSAPLTELLPTVALAMHLTSLKSIAFLSFACASGLFAAPPVTVTVLDEKFSAASSLENWIKTST